MDILRRLYIIATVFAYYFITGSHCLECVNVANCLCFDYGTIEFQCPKNDPEISVTITPKNYVEVQCNGNDTPYFDLDILPEIDANDSVVFKLGYCYLNTTFNSILRKFNMRHVKYLYFESVNQKNNNRIIDVSKELFESMQTLESLSLQYSTLNISIDFLQNTPNLLQLSLEKNNLIQIDKYFSYVPKLNVLNLSRNQIGFLPDDIFKDLNNLTRLFLWNNNLTGLTRNMFSGLNNLQLLELSSNHIEQIAEDTFSDLHNLVNFSLRLNNIRRTYSDMFKNNSLLENVRLSFNDEIVLADYVFANLPLLNTVDLSSNKLEDIPENVFKKSYNLTAINLNVNRLTNIPEKTFDGLSRLKKLDLSHNAITSDSLTAQTFASLVSLEELNFSDNQLTSIAGKLFQKLYHLKVLNLKNNRISWIDPISFSSLKHSLTYLDLSNNQWNGTYYPINDVTPLNNCLELETLILSHNLINEYPVLPALLKLKKIDLSYNQIEELSVKEFAQSTQYTFEVNLIKNRIRHVDFSVAEGTAKLNAESKDTVHHNGASTIIYLNNNPIVCDYSIYDLTRYNNDDMKVLKTLVDIKQDNLTCVDDNKRHVKDIKPYHIERSIQQGCPPSCSCFFRFYNSEVRVDCSFNNLTSYPRFYINIVDGQQTMLDLRGNSFNNGPVEGLNYENITYLDLSENSISEMTWIPPNIKELNLNNNKLARLSSNFIDILKYTSSLERVYLRNNLWTCDCDALDLQNFLMEYYRKVNPSDVYCYDKQIELVEITDLCKMSPYLTVMLPIVLTVLFCFALTFALYYRYQTEIKIYLYAKNLCLWFVTEEELDKDKTYDVFISYSHQDEKFVVDHLLPELERGETPYKVCIHIRDFIPGEFITTQVVNSVKNSRRTLVVLSDNFVDSVWGKLEFRTAHTEAISEGRARVIVVIYGNLNEDKVDDELKSYLKTNTYVKWGDKYFWNKIKYALPHSKNKNFYENNRKQAKIMLKIDDKFDLLKNPPSPTNTSTPPITLDPSMLEKDQIKINIPNKLEGEDPLLARQS